MNEITKCLNEWNATIEALGQGKQTILIRKYNTTLNEFLLYPTVSYAKKLYHGKYSVINHSGKKIFLEIENPCKVARYHSLAILEETLSEEFLVEAKTADNEIMAIRHKEYNLFGLQFHPESIYTPEGLKMIRNFLNISN